MRYLVVIVLLVAAAWYFHLRDRRADDLQVRVVPPTPEKQFTSVLSANPVEAESLATLCQTYPGLGAQFLKNREFKIHGVIKDFRLSGMDGRRAEILLRTKTQRQLIITYNLDQYFRLGLNERRKGRYSIVDTELFLLDGDGQNKKLLFAKELEVTQIVATRSFGATNIAFLAVTNAPSGGAL
jgi:hypothetical protein